MKWLINKIRAWRKRKKDERMARTICFEFEEPITIEPGKSVELHIDFSGKDINSNGIQT